MASRAQAPDQAALGDTQDRCLCLPGPGLCSSWAGRSALGAAGQPHQTSPCLGGQRSTSDASGHTTTAVPTPAAAQVPRANKIVPGRATSEQLLLQPFCCLLLPPPPDSIQSPFLKPGEESTMPFRFPKSHPTGLRRQRSPVPRRMPHSRAQQAAVKSPLWRPPAPHSRAL